MAKLLALSVVLLLAACGRSEQSAPSPTPPPARGVFWCAWGHAGPSTTSRCYTSEEKCVGDLDAAMSIGCLPVDAVYCTQMMINDERPYDPTSPICGATADACDLQRRTYERYGANVTACRLTD